MNRLQVYQGKDWLWGKLFGTGEPSTSNENTFWGSDMYDLHNEDNEEHSKFEMLFKSQYSGPIRNHTEKLLQ